MQEGDCLGGCLIDFVLRIVASRLSFVLSILIHQYKAG